MSPPELPGPVPRADAPQPVEADAAVHRGVEGQRAVLERLDRRPRKLGHVAPPLERDERLDACAGALAVADGVPVALALLQPALAPEPVDDVLGRLVLGQPDQ